MLCSMYANAECVYVISLTEWRVRDVDIAKCFGRMVEWVDWHSPPIYPHMMIWWQFVGQQPTSTGDADIALRVVCVMLLRELGVSAWEYAANKKIISVFYVFPWWSLCPADVPAFALDSGSPPKVLGFGSGGGFGFGRCQLLTNAHKPDAGDVHTIQSQMPRVSSSRGMALHWMVLRACSHELYGRTLQSRAFGRYHIKLCAHQHHIMPTPTNRQQLNTTRTTRATAAYAGRILSLARAKRFYALV